MARRWLAALLLLAVGAVSEDLSPPAPPVQLGRTLAASQNQTVRFTKIPKTAGTSLQVRAAARRPLGAPPQPPGGPSARLRRPADPACARAGRWTCVCATGSTWG